MLFGIIQRKQFLIEDGCHAEPTMFVVLNGSFSLTMNNRNVSVKKNDVVYFAKEVPFKRDIFDTLKIIFIQFDAPLALESGVLSFRDVWRKNGTVQLLYEAVRQNRQDMCAHFVQDLVSQNCLETQLMCQMYSNEVQSFISMVSQSNGAHISVSSYAKSVFMTPTGFLLKFKREYGQTPLQFICSCRLRKASDLLLNTNMSVGEIATACGFENAYYFSNFFKNQTNVSPSAYRKNMVG